MDYHYENLGDERFQEFCSCLISKEFPHIQAFPVGQPDGGRDTIVYSFDDSKKFKVFQVKFVRNALEERDVHKWLAQVIRGESSKINELIKRGAIEYYIMTNVRGTAHLDSGSKDIVNKILSETIKIPAICWWRDDITALFEKDPIFKWSFPQILNGQDILNSILFSNLKENKERQESVIRSYLADQFDIDSEVKFKQIDLQNRLLSLYTDVPLRVKKINQRDKDLKKILSNVFNASISFSAEDAIYHDNNSTIGAAEFLLHPTIQDGVKKVLIEGGPGQGKSTISQYVCQIHRSKLLGKVDDLKEVPLKISNAPARLPFKIDLRDVAAWVEGINPYVAVLPDEYFQRVWKNSLESFIISHIFYHSQIDGFTMSDFLAICKISPILFVFDGFDEIANIKSRGNVIEFINKGIHRLSVNLKSIQIIITSRPAAFSESVVFSKESYPHFELAEINTNIINEYVGKWIKASKLNSRDASEIKKLAHEKLKLPHLKELAKSPMQLAIFLSLLRTKGQSLPNKRTALYDSYINLFFDRESEKSNLVRDKRDLISDIHQYLAWVLHSEAERYKNSGSIKFDDLKTRLKTYLESEGHDISIADQLFDALKERVCALVSRVQGTFEFEVQPLREYFCAKYLYSTAQNSTAGTIKTGTKPDRFHVIIRNPYWQNVVRFFAGCVDAGELDMIIQELRDLQADPLQKFTHYPRIITAQILSDYVFTQKPKKLINVVKLIVDGINIGNIVNQNDRSSRNEHIMLPDECGRSEITIECFRQLVLFPNSDYASELIGIIKNNPHGNLEIWRQYLRNLDSDEHVTKWFEFAYRLELLHQMDAPTVSLILNSGKDEHLLRRINVILNGRGETDLELKHKQLILDWLLSLKISSFARNLNSSFMLLMPLLNPYILRSTLYHGDSNTRFEDHLKGILELGKDVDVRHFNVNNEIDKIICDYKDTLEKFFNFQLSDFRNSLEPWDILVENGRNIFGDNWTFYVIATISAGVKVDEDFSEFSDINNDSLSLCKRARCARLKSGNIKYWESQFLATSNLNFSLLVFFVWATPRAIIELPPLLSGLLINISKDDYDKLLYAVSVSSMQSQFGKSGEKFIMSEIGRVENYDTLKYLMSFRFSRENRDNFILNYVGNNTLKSKEILSLKLQSLINNFVIDSRDEKLLDEIKEIYLQAPNYSDGFFHMQKPLNKMSYEIAKKIMTNCKDYPRVVGAMAELTCRIRANENLKPVSEIAEAEKWFD